MIKIISFFYLMMFSLVSLGATGWISKIEAKSGPSGLTDIVITVNEKVRYHYFKLDNPQRLVIDFDDTKTYLTEQSLLSSNSLIKKFRIGRPQKNTLRVVFDLQRFANVQSISLKMNSTNKGQLLLQLIEKNRQAVPVAKMPTNSLSSRTTSTSLSSLSKNVPGRNVVVVIDAGHGGKDPGAIGKGGTREKDVVLAIAKELARLISQQPGMKAVMTRNGNYYVTLRDRLHKARQNKGDIFVAIHADAFKNSNSRGASVYALSLKGASSEAARWLAAKENYSELGGVDLDGKNDLLRSVLIDLSQTATISASLELGINVLHEMAQIGKLHYRHVEQAPFVVLKSPDIPSILVETGFLSNPYEEKKLKDPLYQHQIATAVMRGIRDYFYLSPPPGTKIALLKNRAHHYVIGEGDTLTSIAKKFNVTVDELRRENQLLNRSIYAGQRIKIPKNTA